MNSIAYLAYNNLTFYILTNSLNQVYMERRPIDPFDAHLIDIEQATSSKRHRTKLSSVCPRNG